jgi:hypothetical protein
LQPFFVLKKDGKWFKCKGNDFSYIRGTSSGMSG